MLQISLCPLCESVSHLELDELDLLDTDRQEKLHFEFSKPVPQGSFECLL